ncbi:MAG: DsbA family oxidoreductase [Azonexus sp.]
MLTIEIVSDIVCPWCYIGTRRLDAALAEVRRDRPDFACRTVWRPFFLNPDTPPEGEPYRPFLEKKFGGPERVAALFAHVRQAGLAYGLDFQFEKIEVRANTLQAHRLIFWAQQQGDARPLIDRLFAAQFLNGENVSDPVVLVGLAGEVGYSPEAVRNYLATAQDAELVRDLERQARHMGINMVPTFRLDRQRLVVGAEDPAVLAAAIRQVLA